MKGRTFNTANLPVCLIDFNYTRDTNTAKFDSYFRHFGESVIFVFRQTKSKFAHGEWRSLSANPAAMCELICPAVAIQTLNRQSSKASSSRQQSVIGSGQLNCLINPHRCQCQTRLLIRILRCVLINCITFR